MIVDLPKCQTLSPEDIARSVRNLPSAPKVLPRLKRLLTDGDSSIHDIVSLIRLDPGIAARVLQTANSSYFGKSVRCLTVDEAVHRVGYDHVYELVSYAVSSQVLVRPLEAYGIEADELWKMSVVCALAAEALAGSTGLDQDIAYTIGLLHCVGMVAINEWAVRQPQTFLFTGLRFPREATLSERAQLGFTQAAVGSALLVDWAFPSSMAEPVRWQYTPHATGAHLRMACLLYAAKWLRSTICARSEGDLPPPAEAVQLLPIGLTPAALADLTPQVIGRLAEVSSLLEPADDATTNRARFPAQNFER